MKKITNSQFFILALLFWYLLILISTLILSVFGGISSLTIIPIYLIYLFFIIYEFKKNEIKVHFDKSLLVLAPILILTFLQGLIAAPNTTDSLVYHLTRVIYWIQQGSVFQSEIYTHHDYLSPLADYAMMHLYLITNSDRLTFLSQWLSYLGVLVVSYSLISDYIKEKYLQNISLLIIATIPMMVLQATSTQVDLVTTFLFLTSIYFALKYFKEQSFNNALLMGISIGLGILVKGTFLIFQIVPLGIFLLFLSKGFFRSAKHLLFISIVILLLTSAFFYQNINLFQTPLGYHQTSSGQRLILTNETFSPQVTISNLLRNLFIQLPLPLFNSDISNSLAMFHTLITLDINDPRTTWYGERFNVPAVLYPQEDLVASPLQLGLILLSIGTLVFTKHRLNKELILILVGLILSFILFSTVFKWQPWHNRLLLPIISAATIVSLIVLQNKKKLLLSFAIISYTLALSVILLNYSRPYLPYHIFKGFAQAFNSQNATLPEPFYFKDREMQYFNSRPYWYSPYNQVADQVQQSPAKSVCLNLIDSFEYPLLKLIKEKDPSIFISKNCAEKDLYIYSSPSIEQYKEQQCFKTEIDYGFICVVRLNNG